MSAFKRYFEAISFLEGLSNLPLQSDYFVDRTHPERYLKRMRYFLNLLGNPDRGLTFIHIGGTAGKGTVTTMLHEILLASGKKVGSFTSPFVTTSIEKIRVNEKYISPDELADIVEYLKPFIDKNYLEGPYGRVSYFEIFFAIALIHFQRSGCDIIVLEVGLGGRYDATNVIEKPIITAITNIDYDHTEILGKTLDKIAYDKAGIIKAGSMFFTAEQRSKLVRMFQKICSQKNVDFQHVGHQTDYQEYNKTLVVAIAHYLKISAKHIDQGIKNSRLQCRFEIVQNKPLVVLDGAHNRSKIRSTIVNLKKLRFTKLYLIIGIADSKDSIAILEQIIPLADHVFFTRFQIKDRKCAHPKELLAASRRYLKKGSRADVSLDPERCMSQALQKAGDDDLILVAGSFFLAGEIRKDWVSEEQILKKRKSFDYE